MMVLGLALIVRAAKGSSVLRTGNGVAESAGRYRSYAMLSQADCCQGNKERLLAFTESLLPQDVRRICPSGSGGLPADGQESDAERQCAG